MVEYDRTRPKGRPADAPFFATVKGDPLYAHLIDSNFRVACDRAGIAAALQEGWTDLCRDDGPGWNYLGVCPECQAQEQQVAEPEAPEPDQQKRLFG